MIEFLLFLISEASEWEYEKGGTVRAATIAREFQWVWDEKNVRKTPQLVFDGIFMLYVIHNGSYISNLISCTHFGKS